MTLHTYLKIMPRVCSNRPPGHGRKYPFIKRWMRGMMTMVNIGSFVRSFNRWNHNCKLKYNAVISKRSYFDIKSKNAASRNYYSSYIIIGV
jgi:hypothetical protein